jgi:phospholipid/cholesterol/gamma-HCH transport system permease protein
MEFVIRRFNIFVTDLGNFGILLIGMFKSLPRIFKDRMLIIEQMMNIGVNSLVLISIIGLFTGAVSAWQAAYQMAGLVSNNILGSATSKAIIIELGPVLAAIVLAGRVGASIAAELGTMKVTEQIDALEAMAINPIRYLAMPRVIATTIMLPILVIYAVTIAIFGSFLVSTLFIGIPSNTFMNGFKESFQIMDFNTAMIKAVCFGVAISSIGCFVGFQTKGGAQGVGQSTIKSFVICAASILILDYILWNLLVG